MDAKSLEASFLSSDEVEIGRGFLLPRRGILCIESGMPKIVKKFVDEVANVKTSLNVNDNKQHFQRPLVAFFDVKHE